MLKVLEERNFPINQLKLLASKKSVGKIIKYAGADIAVARTHQIGHGSDSRCIYIGNELELIDN